MAEEEKKQPESIKEDTQEENNFTLYWIVGIMVLALLIVFSYPYIVRSYNNFNYEGLSFSKEKFEELVVYHYSRYYRDPTGQMIKYNLYLRNDPRELDHIIVNGEIGYQREGYTYLSVNSTGLQKCPKSTLAIAGLAGFLVNNEVEVKGATPDYNESIKKNTAYATCDNFPDNVVILVQEGNETRIDKRGMCHVVSVANCEVLEVLERFEVQSLVDAENRRKNEGLNQTN